MGKPFYKGRIKTSSTTILLVCISLAAYNYRKGGYIATLIERKSITCSTLWRHAECPLCPL